MADRPVQATGSRKPEGAGKRTLGNLSIEPSKNGGFTVEQRYKVERKEKASGPCCYDGYVEPDKYTFESKDSLIAHLTKTL